MLPVAETISFHIMARDGCNLEARRDGRRCETKDLEALMRLIPADVMCCWRSSGDNRDQCSLLHTCILPSSPTIAPPNPG